MLSPLFFFLLLLSPFLTNGAESEPSSLKMKLFRIPSDPSKTRLDRFHDLIQSDHARRLRRLSSVEAEAEGFRMSIRSGADDGVGEFLVRVRVGTPARKFLLVIDTGSDLTWVKCKYKRIGSARETGTPLFDADGSKTFSPIPCLVENCAHLRMAVPECPTPASPCLYDYQYGSTAKEEDGLVASKDKGVISGSSNVKGFYANESVSIGLTNGRRQKLEGLFGCTLFYSDPVFDRADGVLGLGHSDVSFASQVIDRFSGKFSYCLVDYLSMKNASGYMTFGPSAILNNNQSAVQETDLIIGPEMDPYYGAAVIGISVDGEILKIPMSVWNVSRKGGAIIDSGMTLTLLAEPAYGLVVGALREKLEGVPVVTNHIFDFCYNWTEGVNITAPKLVVHFAGQARLEPPVKSYLIEVGQLGERVRCIGIRSIPFPGVSVIGNILQQEHLWEFDLKNRKVRFQPSTCKKKY